jgi:predicted nucleic acid-binding protein
VPSIVVDAGPLIALFDRDDSHHRKAVEFVRGRRDRLITNLPVVTEAVFVLRFSVEAQRDLLWWVHQSLEIDQGTAGDLPRITALFEKYRDIPADFADVSIVAMAERLDISRVASVDSDFAIYRMAGNRRFENVFLNDE